MFLTIRKNLTARSFLAIPVFTLMLWWCSDSSRAFGDEFSPQAVQGSIELRANLNTFCWNMWNTYNDESEEFYDAYREAFELLQVSDKIKNATMTKGSAANVKRWMLEIESEVHHVEHHLEEFSDRANFPAKGKEKTLSSLESVEDSLDSLMDILGIEAPAHGEHGEHEEHAEADFVKAAVSAGELQSLANVVCAAMYQDYNNASLEFLEIYKEAYELMISAKNLTTKLQSVEDEEEIHDMVAALDKKIHQVESGASAFVGRTEAGNELAQSELLNKIDAVEIKLHSLKRELALGGSDDVEDDHKHAATTIKYEGTTAELAKELALAATSLSRALQHNYKKNSDFAEALDEITEFKEICKQIATMIVNDQISKDCKRLISGLDGELHHLEEHVKNFSRDDTKSQDQFGRANRKLIQVEQFLHVLMSRAGIKRKHVD